MRVVMEMSGQEFEVESRSIMDSINEGLSFIGEDFQYHFGGDPE